MKNKIGKELILQVSIILICLVVLLFRFTSMPIRAQITCNDEPPLMDSIFPLREAWPQGKTVSVVVFDTPDQDEFEEISDSIRLWNVHRVANCSNVTFNAATRANRPYDPNEPIPDDTIFVIRPSNSQFIPQFRNPGGPAQNIRAGTMRIQYPFTSHTPGAFRKLVAHETGHSFGLRNETFPSQAGRSIMGSAFDITSCDTEAVRKVYCPTPTPTPTPTPPPDPCFPWGCDECPCNDCVYGCDPPDEPECHWESELYCTNVCVEDEYGEWDCDEEECEWVWIWVCE